MYEIMICPVKKLYELASEGDMSEVGVLAVSSYEIPKEKLRSFCTKLCLSFDDTTSKASKNAFTEKLAQEIADYIKALPDFLDTLFVCCDSGESRSSAMAAAILRYTKQDEMLIWRNPQYHPNALVYQLLCKAFGLEESEEELAKKLRINEEAFLHLLNS